MKTLSLWDFEQIIIVWRIGLFQFDAWCTFIFYQAQELMWWNLFILQCLLPRSQTGLLEAGGKVTVQVLWEFFNAIISDWHRFCRIGRAVVLFNVAHSALIYVRVLGVLHQPWSPQAISIHLSLLDAILLGELDLQPSLLTYWVIVFWNRATFQFVVGGTNWRLSFVGSKFIWSRMQPHYSRHLLSLKNISFFSFLRMII